MTKDEALELLDTAPADGKPSRLNLALTRLQGMDIVRAAVKSPRTKDPLDRLLKKRVWQLEGVDR